MNKPLLLAALLGVLSLPAFAQGSDRDDFGLWGEISLTKRLPHNLSVGIDMEGRMRDNVQTFDRWSAGLTVGYKPWKHLKLAAGYVFMQSYTPHKRKESYKGQSHEGEADYWHGFNINEDYLTPKHRFVAMATLESPKLWKWVRVSLRERYQLTHRAAKHYMQTEYRYTYSSLSGFSEADVAYDPKMKPCRTVQSLRSRLKVEMDKKRIDWHPFVSLEAYNNVQDKMSLTDWRLSAGTSWNVSRDHSISAAYIYNVEKDVEDNMHQHVLSIGYEYKF